MWDGERRRRSRSPPRRARSPDYRRRSPDTVRSPRDRHYSRHTDQRHDDGRHPRNSRYRSSGGAGQERDRDRDHAPRRDEGRGRSRHESSKRRRYSSSRSRSRSRSRGSSSSRSRSPPRQHHSRTDHDRREKRARLPAQHGSDRTGERHGSPHAKPAPASAAAAAAAAAAAGAGLFSRDAADEPTGLAPSFLQDKVDVRQDYERRRREALDAQAAHAKAQAEEPDALDAFMEAAVLPEVAARDAEAQRRAEEEERQRQADLAAGKRPAADRLLDLEEEPEEAPALEFTVPEHKVKLIIGAGGERIKQIQRKSGTRIQVKRSEEELQRGFGEGARLRLPGQIAVLAAKQKEQAVAEATIQVFGHADKAALAQKMLLELVENKDQKQRQRQKEYDKKKDEKRRNRQIYHMRHTRDYAALEVPVGTPKAEIKEAYRRLAKKWHPDRHPENREEAKAKFQAIQKAYDSLMSTDEEVALKSLGS